MEGLEDWGLGKYILHKSYFMVYLHLTLVSEHTVKVLLYTYLRSTVEVYSHTTGWSMLTT